MEENKIYFEPKSNSLQASEKQINKIKWGKKDSVFVPIFLAAVFIFVDFAVMHGFNLGFTVSFFILFAVFSAYLFDSKIRVSPFAFICGVLSLAGAVTFSLYKDELISFITVFLVFALFGIYLLGLSGGMKINRGSYKMLFEAIGSVFVYPLSNAHDIAAACSKSMSKNKISKNVIIGIALSLPVLLVIIPLLVSSDEAFEGLIKIVLKNAGIYLLEIVIALIATPFVVFYAVSRKNSAGEHIKADAGRGKGFVQSAAAVSFLSVISFTYIVYLFSQLAYFFSAFSGILPEGYEYTASVYARRGFFEMFAICVINMIIIALSNMLTKRNARGRIPLSVKALSVFILSFTVLILITAMSKMKLNIAIFGMSKNRLLVSVFMIMILVVIAFYIVHIFWPRVNYIQPVTVICSAMFVALAFMNVNDFVIKYNIDAYNSGKIQNIDLEYIAELSDSPALYLIALTQSENKETANKASALIAGEIGEKYPEVFDDTEIGNYETEIKNKTSADFRSFNYFRDKVSGSVLEKYYNALSAGEREKLFNRYEFCYGGSYYYDSEKDMFESYNDVYCFEYGYNEKTDLYEYIRQYEYDFDKSENENDYTEENASYENTITDEDNMVVVKLNDDFYYDISTYGIDNGIYKEQRTCANSSPLLHCFLFEFEKSVGIAVGVLALPAPAVLTHFLNIALRFPAELFKCLARVGIAGSQIARAAGADYIWNLHSRRFFKRLYNVKHRISLARAEIIDKEPIFSVNLFNSFQMSESEIYNMDIVPYPCSVRRVVIIAVNI